MQSAKLMIDQFGFDSSTPEATSETTNEVLEPGLGDKMTVLINDIAIAMKTLDYALYKGKIYKKCEGSKYTYSYKCDVKAFVNSLAANESFKSRLIRDMKRVIDLRFRLRFRFRLRTHPSYTPYSKMAVTREDLG